MSNVVSLEDARKRRKPDPHVTGPAVCLDCRHEWVGVAPDGTVWLACPKCTLVRGRFIGHVVIGGASHWTCNCGCDLFHVTKENFYCPNCGAVQNGLT